jgi:hypothetical protein
MDTIAIVLEIDAEITRLQQVKQLLTAVKATEKRKPGRPSAAGLPANATKAIRTISAASRENIAAAQKKRWAKVRRAKKAALNAAAAPATKKSASKSTATEAVSTKKTASAKKTNQAKPKPPVAPTPQPTEK